MSTCGDFGGTTADGSPCGRASNDGRCAMHNGEGRTGGRKPIEITDEQREQVEKLAAVLTQDQLADFLGFTDRTLRRKMKTDPDLASSYQKGRARAVAGVATNLMQQARNGNTTAAIFFLKTQGGWSEKHEIVGADGGAIAVEITRRVVTADADG